MNWPKISVNAKRGYPILLGVPLEQVGDYLRSSMKGISRVGIITNQVLADFYLERLLKGLEEYKVDTIIIPQGEEAKSLHSISYLTEESVRLGLDRHSLIIALGGGVIGDLAGFFASIYMRGIPFLQIPTTLLAQVDSSIGGKVAVNHPVGKNLLGAFYPPIAVWLDYMTLESLPWSEVQNGLAECIKHAILGDAELFGFIELHAQEIMQKDSAIWRELIPRSLAVKVRIVSEDEEERGIRALLNLGHSFGHALEAEGKYREFSHGQGVSIGIVAAAHLAKQRGYIQAGDVKRIIDLLNLFELPTAAAGKDPARLLALMAADKKNEGGKKILILPKGVGQAVVCKDCSDDEILRAWEQVI